MPDTTPHKPTDATRDMVSKHAIVGTPQALIADMLGITPKTLRKYYRDELDHAGAKATAAVGGSLYSKAMGGDPASMIFWMKTRGGWSEATRIDHTSSDGSMSPTRVEIVSPDDHSEG